MRWDQNSVRNGMFVMGTQGERIGKVIRCDTDTFVVEKGVFFPKDYELRYDHITEMKDGTIYYSLTDYLKRQDLASTSESARAAGTNGSGAASKAAAAASAAAARAMPAATSERSYLSGADEKEIHMPLMKEELGVEKVSRETGHVIIHKSVKTEERHFTIPVSSEEISIEHVAVSRDAPAGTEALFQEQTLDIPLHEEDLRVTKRPMQHDEVVVRTVAHAVEKEGTTTLRREEVEIEDTRKRAPAREGEVYSTPGARR